jgi:prephenate dehydratase
VPSHKRIAFPGEPGANSHIACREVYPEYEAVPFATFDEGFTALDEGMVELAMIPAENSTAGRVAETHRLLPESGLYVVAEHFRRVRHCLLAPTGASTETLLTVHSHPQALAQCRGSLLELGLTLVAAADTASAAREVAESQDPTKCAVASRLAGEIFGLAVLREDLEDHPHNTTRFIVLSREELRAATGVGPTMTTLVFDVRNTSAALCKALGGFAANDVSMTKLESCSISGQFFATRFLAEVEGHPDEPPVGNAFMELGCHADYRILGVYPADSAREWFKQRRFAPADARGFPPQLASMAGSSRGEDTRP